MGLFDVGFLKNSHNTGILFDSFKIQEICKHSKIMFLPLFKLAVRLQTSRASKNRFWPDENGGHFLMSELCCLALVPFSFYGMRIDDYFEERFW